MVWNISSAASQNTHFEKDSFVNCTISIPYGHLKHICHQKPGYEPKLCKCKFVSATNIKIRHYVKGQNHNSYVMLTN